MEQVAAFEVLRNEMPLNPDLLNLEGALAALDTGPWQTEDEVRRSGVNSGLGGTFVEVARRILSPNRRTGPAESLY